MIMIAMVMMMGNTTDPVIIVIKVVWCISWRVMGIQYEWIHCCYTVCHFMRLKPFWSMMMTMILLQEHTPLKIKCIRHTSQLAGGSSLSQERGGIRGGRPPNHVFIGHHITQSIFRPLVSLQHHYYVVERISPFKFQDAILSWECLTFNKDYQSNGASGKKKIVDINTANNLQAS